MSAKTESCKDRTPAFCMGKVKFCTQPKAQKVMTYKCQKTCGLCAEKTTQTSQTETVEKFGPWGTKWSRCVRGKENLIKIIYKNLVSRLKNTLYFSI